MTQTIHPLALFRLSVLGPLASRDSLSRGELQSIIKELSSKTYAIPHSRRTHLSAQVIERWYYAWRRNGIDGLIPKARSDRHKTHLPEAVQAALIAAKKDKPSRSIDRLIALLMQQGIVGKGELSRATVHRFLHKHQLSKRTSADAATIERRSFVAEHVGDVMHGPTISTPQGTRKVYLVSLMDDASRLITHSAFCFGETALDIEGVLKQAVLKRGIPKKLIIDNGSAYRAHSLQGVCARLEIRLIYCPAYEPQGKGKIERYHRTFRESFLDELDMRNIKNLDDLNARLWVWVEQAYHRRPHAGLDNKLSPIDRWRQELIQIRMLDPRMNIEQVFCHRHTRKVRKDATIQWEGCFYEVPYQYEGQTVVLVVDPHADKALYIENQNGGYLAAVTPLAREANTYRKRQRPLPASAVDSVSRSFSSVEMLYEQQERALGLSFDHLTFSINTDQEETP